MQHRYVGDVGDFAKYSLLNALSGEYPSLATGVLWYLFPDESHNGDGRHVSYLDQPVLAKRDPDTHAKLATLVRAGQRSVTAVEQTGIIANAKFFTDVVAIKASPKERVDHRAAWFGNGIAALAGSELVFFDPDNGIETASLKSSDFRAGKYAFWKEIEAVWAMGSSLVVYNHLNRTASADAQTARLRAAFLERLPLVGLCAPLLFRRGSCRHLWVIAQPRHSEIFRERITAFLKRGWHEDTDCDF